jgi:hypothetical protein
MPQILSPNPAPPAEGYYVKRDTVVRTAGVANFNADFNLEENATVADETIVQKVFDQADRYVDSRAYDLGIVAAGTPPHFISTTDAIFAWLSDWASRWARAQGYLLRGTTGDPQNTAEGQMATMKEEAEKKIDELLKRKRYGTLGGNFVLAGTGRATLPVMV